MNKINVVSVDDHYLIHTAIHGLLADYENIELVGEGFAGASVFPLVEQHKPNVLILDLLMPQQQGGDLGKDSFQPIPALAQLREEYPDTAIIILSQYLNQAIVQGAIQHGVRGYLLKSDNLSLNLPDAIEQVSRGGVYFSLEVSRQLFQRPETPSDDLLTYRQRQIILAIAKSPDTPYSEIADRFAITYRTVKGHLDLAYKALGVSNITACIIRCMQLGLIPFTQNGRGILFGDL
jgi:DNA-binding NarL/FixJ family response regulator